MRNSIKHSKEFADALQQAEKQGWEIFETHVRYEGVNYVWTAWVRRPIKK